MLIFINKLKNLLFDQFSSRILVKQRQ